MEGVASEAASLAGHLGLDNLCWVYDNNHITIEGNTRIAFTEDVAARFLGYGWNVLRVGDANDIDRIEHALEVFRQTKGRPTFIILDSHIGYGSPHKQDTPEAHGEPLGEEEIRLTKRSLRLAGGREVPRSRRRSRALRRRHRRARRGGRGAAGRSCSPPTEPSIPNWPPRSTRCNGANCRPAGTAICPSSRPTRRASPGAKPRARC